MLIKENQRDKLLKIIKKDCCYYVGNICEDITCQKVGQCVELLNVESVLCKHCQKYLIPLMGAEFEEPATKRKQCKQCGKSFIPEKSRQVLCNRCKKSNRNEQLRVAKQSSRKKQKATCHTL